MISSSTTTSSRVPVGMPDKPRKLLRQSENDNIAAVTALEIGRVVPRGTVAANEEGMRLSYVPDLEDLCAGGGKTVGYHREVIC